MNYNYEDTITTDISVQTDQNWMVSDWLSIFYCSLNQSEIDSNDIFTHVVVIVRGVNIVIHN